MFDNDRHSPTYGTSIAQYAYQLEPQADIAARIVAAGGTATPTDPRQGRNIGLSAITAINENEFLVLERDNRGIGVDDPAGANVVGSKRIYKIDVRGATDIAARELPSDGNLAAAVPPIVPVTKSPDVFIDLAANTQLPNGKQVDVRGGARNGAAIGWLLFVANAFWVVAYDTEYAMVDRDDDLRLGIRSSAIFFGRFDVVAVMISYAAFVLLLLYVGYLMNAGWPFYAGCALAAALAIYHFFADPRSFAGRLHACVPP